MGTFIAFSQQLPTPVCRWHPLMVELVEVSGVMLASCSVLGSY